MEKLSFIKLIPDAKKVADHCSKCMQFVELNDIVMSDGT